LCIFACLHSLTVRVSFFSFFCIFNWFRCVWLSELSGKTRLSIGTIGIFNWQLLSYLCQNSTNGYFTMDSLPILISLVLCSLTTVKGVAVKLMSHLFQYLEFPAASVNSLGITLDNRLSLNQHITNVCKACYYHIQALRHVRDSLPDDVAKIVVVSIITSRLDCNSLFFGMSAKTFLNYSVCKIPLHKLYLECGNLII